MIYILAKKDFNGALFTTGIQAYLYCQKYLTVQAEGTGDTLRERSGYYDLVPCRWVSYTDGDMDLVKKCIETGNFPAAIVNMEQPSSVSGISDYSGQPLLPTSDRDEIYVYAGDEEWLDAVPAPSVNVIRNGVVAPWTGPRACTLKSIDRHMSDKGIFILGTIRYSLSVLFSDRVIPPYQGDGAVEQDIASLPVMYEMWGHVVFVQEMLERLVSYRDFIDYQDVLYIRGYLINVKGIAPGAGKED